MDDIILTMNLLTLGKQPSEDLPSVATAALASGIDSEARRELAGTSPRDVRDARDLFFQAADELGLSVPSEEEARHFLVRQWANEIIEGKLSPHVAAGLINWEGRDSSGAPQSLSIFGGLADEWDVDAPRRSLYDSDMLKAAKQLLESDK